MPRIALAATAVLLAAAAAFAERLPLRIYSSADGLATSAAFNVVRDARGFIWVCTRDGLVRFDGYRFINYKIGDRNADPAVFDLITTRSGDYWINLNRGTDYKFAALDDRRTVLPLPSAADIRVPFPAEPLTGSTFPRLEDQEGWYWSADPSGLFRWNKEGAGVERIPVDLPGNPSGMFLFADFRAARRGDGFWVGTNWGLLRRFPDGRILHATVEPEGTSDMIRPFAEDAEGRVWIVKPEGIIVLRPPSDFALNANSRANVSPGEIAADGVAKMPVLPWQAFKFKLEDVFARRGATDAGPLRMTSRPIVSSIFVDSRGRVWISSTRGLALFDGERFRYYSRDNGLAMNDVSAMTEGIDGSIWILSYGGLHRLNPNGVTSYDEHDGIERERILSIQEDAAGRVVTIAANFYVSTFDGRRFRSARPNIPTDETVAWQSSGGLLDSRGDLWLQTHKKLYFFRGVSDVSQLDGRDPDAVYDDKNGLIGGNVVKTFEDSKGNLWFSNYLNSERRGLTRFDRATGEFKSFSGADGLPDPPVATAFAEAPDGSLLFGFTEGGMARYRDGKFTPIRSEAGPTGGVTAMRRDAKGRVWLATSRDGLLLMEDASSDSPSFLRFTTADGLASNNLRSITEGADGDIYVGTVRGVNRLSPDTGRVAYFGPADGLASDFVSSIYRDRTGNVWIGTFNGLSRLSPRPESEDDPPGILISGLRVAGEDYAISPVGQSEVHIPDVDAGAGGIQVDFLSAGSSFSTPARYQYRTAPSSEWSEPSAGSSVNFASLPAGAFRLEVRAMNEHGVVSNTPAFVQFNVLRPVWQRWWFLLLAAAAFGAIVYSIYRYRIAQAVKLERIRTRIASDLHDDIGSSLSQIAILSEIARQKAGKDGISEPLLKIAETSREMVDSMSDIVWAINPAKDKLGDLVSRMRRFAEEVLDAKGIAYKFEASGTLDVALGTDTRRDAYLIFKEAVSNVVKHSAAANVRVAVVAVGRSVSFSVEDDGVGYREPDDPDRTFPGFGGNGLINMRRRAEGCGGTFAFRSRPGEGARVQFTLPTRAGVVVS